MYTVYSTVLLGTMQALQSWALESSSALLRQSPQGFKIDWKYQIKIQKLQNFLGVLFISNWLCTLSHVRHVRRWENTVIDALRKKWRVPTPLGTWSPLTLSKHTPNCHACMNNLQMCTLCMHATSEKRLLGKHNFISSEERWSPSDSNNE